MRPVLSPVRRLWRDPQTLQLGRPGDRALVLAGLDEPTRAALALLDGTRDVVALERAAGAVGCPPERLAELLSLLSEAGLVVDAGERWPGRLEVADRDRLAPDVASLGLLHDGAGLAVLRRRAAASVVVVGGGRVGAPLAALLAAAGVGTVDVLDDGRVRPVDVAVGGVQPRDAGRRRGEAARARLRTVSASTCTGPVDRPDLVVLAPAGAMGDDEVAALHGRRTPHLLAEVRDTVGVVGPLVLPGSSTCLRCLDLARTERDPDWPALAVQLSNPTRAAPPCDAVLAAAVSAQAAQQALTLLDGGEPASLDGSLELALPDWRWRRRSWPRHPACSCGWQRSA